MSDKYHIFKFMSQVQCHSKLFTIPLYKPKKKHLPVKSKIEELEQNVTHVQV